MLESPFRGDAEINLAYARMAMADCLARGEAPLASHLLYTQVLDDAEPEQRRLGVDAGLEWHKAAHAVVVYGDRGISPGMRYGIANARRLGVAVEFRYLYRPTDLTNLILQDVLDNPAGHPCRDCGLTAAIHPVQAQDGVLICEAWR